MRLIPITFAQAKEFIARTHRHHKPPQGWKFGVGLEVDGQLVGVACASRPVARMLDDGKTLEVTRLATIEGIKNACSALYAAIRRAAKALGYTRLITYILESEPGTSLKASGWIFVRLAGGGSWSRPSRMRENKAPLERKQLWEAVL